MIGAVTDLAPASLALFDAVIDVRSPAEFAADRLPGAVNLPVLSDAERAEVGRVYVQESRQRARRIGAALVARNIAGHLDGPLAEKDGAFAPLVYCWRGGQRSHAMATVLEQVGWRPSVVAGGYRTWRRRVTAALYDAEPAFRLLRLDGDTGTGKTDILGRVAALGAQTLDLEGLAAHRGSLFGAIPGVEQPGQKRFESLLLAALETLDPARPILVEAESSKIGAINLPPVLWKAMAAAPRVELTASREERALYLAQAYGDLAIRPERLADILARLPGRHGARRVAEWLEMACAGAWPALAEALIEAHYDPAYRRQRRAQSAAPLAVIEMADMSEASRADAARRVVGLLAETGGVGR